MTTADVRLPARESYWPAVRDHLLYAAIVAAYCLPFLFQRNLYYRDESRYGGVLREMVASDNWFILTIGGEFYPDKPPLFFTLLRLGAELFGSTSPAVFFAVVALTALFFVAASDAFLRAAGFDRRTVRSANLILLAIPWIAIHMQTVRMDLLFSGLMIFSIATYARGLERAETNFLPLVGGLLAGTGVMVKGPFSAAIPFLSIVAFAFVSGQKRKLLRADFLFSVLLMVAPTIIWFSAIAAEFGGQALYSIVNEQIIQRAIEGRDSNRPFWFYPAWLAGTLMPWLALVPILASARFRSLLFAGDGRSDWRGPRPGLRLVLPTLAATTLVLGVVSQKHIHYLLPLIPGLAVIIAIAYFRLDRDATRLTDWFYLSVAVAALAGPPLAVSALDLLPADDLATLDSLIAPGEFARLAAHVALAAIPLAIAARLRGEARLLAGVVSVAVLAFAAKATLLPVLDRIYNPRHVAERFEPLIPAGDRLIVYNIYRGSLSYHFDRPISYVRDEARLGQELARGASDFIATTQRRWQEEPELFAGFAPIAESRIESTDLVLLGRTGSKQVRPAKP